MKNLTILVVDDDPVIRRLLQQRLAKEHYEVTIAEDGHVAESLLEQHHYDVVLTDLMMPGGIGGIEVLEIAKQLHPKTEVVLITAHSSVDSAVEAMKKGATDYLEKPINFDELFLRLDKISNLQTILKSAQDLEQAMTVTESAASETIQNLEIEIARKQELLEQLEKVLLDHTLAEDERIEQALSKLSEI
ncbi:MAG: response regulator [Desulfobulbaceae bacterium]|nr:MAG: response regulator [Desulfobulbaceae bacterium]